MSGRQLNLVVCSSGKVGKGQPSEAGRKLKESGGLVICTKDKGSTLSNASDRSSKMKTKN